MHFSRLRLSGFKSFVDATDFRVEPGLTGVVGPNGCGKSNLLEALRWVMGAASAKAMRGEGMDDVIFSGTGARPARNQAEVTLTIDNADRTAPARFNAEPVLEVARRIDRGEGSTYRINGAEVRARDVQLLFADASTGANSPALVRQGQISELIAAKPQNRRRILEEAAGISGLHGRRHEAQLRVKAAQINLARLDDLARELEANLARLRREARQAERYRKLAAQIRALQSIALYGRWMEARGGLERVEAEAGEAGESALASGRAAAAASAVALKAEAAIKPLRDEETAAAAVLHRLAIDKDRLERELQGAAAEVARRIAEIARIDTDVAREGQIVEDAGRALARLEAETGQMEAEIAAAPQRLPQLRALAEAAEFTRAQAQAAVETLASRVAALEAERTGAQARCEDARGRLSRTERALAQARSERAALGEAADPRLVRAAADRADAHAAVDLAQRVLGEAEAAAGEAVLAEARARAAAREADDALGRLLAESRGLAQLAAGPDGASGFPAALESVAPDPGLEAALAAAMGDDLDAALDRRAPAYWSGGEAAPPAWPVGATPLAPMIAAPPQLAARLAFTALVDAAHGERLQATLPPGARLVSRQGDLWRWDGFTARAQARRPAQIRLEQKARLASLEAQIGRAAPRAEAAGDGHGKAAARLDLAENAVRAARAAARGADASAGVAREALERVEREGVRRDAQAASLDETIARFEVERAEAQASLADALAAAEAADGGDEDLAGTLAAARDTAALARESAASARAALDIEVRDRETRRARLEALRIERTDWSQRAGAASLRQTDLAKDRAKAEAALAAARQAPEAAQARRAALLDDLGAAEARRTVSADALAAAEGARAQADRDARAADAAAADAREARASVAARLDAARDRLADAAHELTATTNLTPTALGQQLLREGGGVLPASGEAPDLAALEREREAIGPVNLRAEEEAGELAVRVAGLRAERTDLAGALGRLGAAIGELNSEGRERLNAAFAVIDGHFRALFTTLFEGGQAELRLVESEDPLEAGLEIYACPPGKRMAVMSLMSGGEQALTAVALIFAVFLANPAPICVLDEVDAPLDDANVDRFCNLLNAMRARAPTRFVAITHNPLTMSRMDRLFGVTMSERGVSQLVSVDLRQAETLAAQ